jgi:dipeptidase
LFGTKGEIPVRKSAIRFIGALAISVFMVGPSLGCTDIVAGKDATVDGSVITSHTADGAFYDARVRIIPGRTHEKGETASVFWNITNEEYGPAVKIGEIPQVEKTYSYFHVGYPFMNEHGVAIGETTIGQKEELKTFRPDARAIMTVEQLEVFGLQRGKTAREAIRVMGDLAEKYGFLPSCGSEGECLTVTDSEEAWIFELRSTGMMWTPESGKPGAIWVAQRVPDDMVVVVPNMSRIQEIDPDDKDNFMVAEGYRQFAIDMGWYDPEGDEPFIWQRAYSPLTGNDDWALSSMWVRNRLHTIHKILAPSQEWDPNAETMSYPFAIKPEKKVSVADVMEMLRSHMTGTPFDMYEDGAWYVRDGEKCVKSPLATPFPNRDVRRLLGIDYNRPVSKWDCAYSFVSQARSDVPDVMRTILWFGYDNPHTSCYVPIYNGVTDTKESWRTFDREQFSLESAQWGFILSDELVNHRYGDAMADLKAVRDPMEKGFFDRIAEVDAEAVKLYKESPEKARKYLTDFTLECMDQVERAWWGLNWNLITKYNNNKFH